MRHFLSLAASFLLTVAALPAHAAPFSSIVVYGDSLSDNGNLFALTGLPPTPYVNGRFSNGPVAVEQLASSLGTPLIDFAYGGATSGFSNILDPALPGILSELYGSTGLGTFLPPGSSSDSLFFVWGGANDFQTLANPSIKESQALAQAAANNIANTVATLQILGATHFLVPNLPDLGQTPEFAGSLAATAYTNAFNAALPAVVSSSATIFDTNAIFNSILMNPSGYGFTNVTTPCILAGANPSCAGYLFFDQIHPTTAADAILARQFEAAVTPEPSSLWLLATGLAGGVGVLRRRTLSA